MGPLAPMNILNSYIPVDRQHALANGQQLPQTAEGAVLFADFRGFTQITDLLYREFGPNRGADVMAVWLEKAFDAIFKPVNDYMGSVIALSGDAMVCWFDNKPPAISAPVPSGAVRATACAIEIRKTMTEYETFTTPSGITSQLGIKVTVTAGEVRRFLVGDPDVQRFEVLTGSVIRRSAEVDHALEESEIAIGSEVIGHFGDEILLGDWRSGGGGEKFRIVKGLVKDVPAIPWPPPPEIDEQIARTFLPSPVFRRLQTGQTEFQADLRPVTPMFINFKGIDFDLDYEAGEKLDRLIRWVQSVLLKYENYLIQITIGDKGSYLYASFGAPIAHEDDTLRAAHAAVDLMNPPADINYMKDVRIGISQGLTYAGAYGGTSRRVFGVLGNEVNIAARLMSMANPGEILVTERVRRVVSSEFDSEDRGNHALKGVLSNVSVFSLKRHSHRHGRGASPGQMIVGREKELGLLRSALTDTLQGMHRTVIIEGEPGIGKSILLEQWSAEVHQMKIPVFQGNGNAIEKSTVYFVWRQIFQVIFGIDDNETLAMVQEKVVERLEQSGLSTLAPLLNRVLSINLPETKQTLQMDSEGRANSTRDLLVTLLKDALKNSPAVLILDDCQYFDSASWSLISNIEVEIPWALLVLSSRPREAGSDHAPEFVQLKNDPKNLVLEIGRLNEAQTAELILHRLKIKHVADPLIKMVTSAAEGHPFFIEELTYALRDAGILQIQNGQGILKGGVTSLVDLDFPLTVQGVITSRIDRLDTHKQLILKTASVIGRIFPVQTLRDIHPSAKGTDLPLKEHLDFLGNLDLVQPEAIEPSLRYIFKHSITHGVVYQTMTHIQRKMLHRRAAEWYENRFAENPSSYYTLMAFHWARAENTAKAIDYYEKAGVEALKNFAHEEAVTFFTQAIQLDAIAGGSNPVERRAFWELQAGEACVYWTKYTQARKHLEEGLRLLGHQVPEPGLRSVFPVLRVFLKQNLHRIAPKAFLQRKAEQSRILQASSRASQRLIEVYYHSGDLLRSIYLTFNSLNLAEMAEESPELVEAYAGAGPFFYFIGFDGFSEAYFERAHDVNHRVMSLRSHAFLLLVHCGIMIGRGRWEEASLTSQALMDTGLQLGSTRRHNDGLQHLTILQYIHAEFNACIATSETLLQSAIKIRDTRFQAYALFGLAYSAHFLGRTEESDSILEEMKQLFLGANAITDEQLIFNMNGLQSLQEARYGSSEESLAAGKRAEEQMGGAFQASFFTLPGYLSTADAYLGLWEADPNSTEAQSRSKSVVDGLGRFARTFAIGRPGHALLAGLFDYLSGKPANARKRWEKGITIAEELDLPYELARLHLEMGRRELGLNPEVMAVHFQKAREGFEMLGLPYELKLVRSASRD